MKKLLTLGAIAMLTVASGCTSGKKPTVASNVTDVSTPPAPIHDNKPAQPYGDAGQPGGYKPLNDGPVEATPVSDRTYTVKKGDTLWGIAQRTYGDGKQYKKIIAANSNIKGDQVYVGQKIRLP